ncbi:uncharacterized protein LOC123642163 [Lemur catta]|uniref:uncharacterized protein LOC123642163 n=1 Tax=Lemur catta TaxID=9447 RepID=UPI001E26B968|nr:uncharacterized protein LOC123642163 [Lemur catta]
MSGRRGAAPRPLGLYLRCSGESLPYLLRDWVASASPWRPAQSGPAAQPENPDAPLGTLELVVPATGSAQALVYTRTRPARAPAPSSVAASDFLARDAATPRTGWSPGPCTRLRPPSAPPLRRTGRARRGSRGAECSGAGGSRACLPSGQLGAASAPHPTRGPRERRVGRPREVTGVANGLLRQHDPMGQMSSRNWPKVDPAHEGRIPNFGPGLLGSHMWSGEQLGRCH